MWFPTIVLSIGASPMKTYTHAPILPWVTVGEKGLFFMKAAAYARYSTDEQYCQVRV